METASKGLTPARTCQDRRKLFVPVVAGREVLGVPYIPAYLRTLTITLVRLRETVGVRKPNLKQRESSVQMVLYLVLFAIYL